MSHISLYLQVNDVDWLKRLLATNPDSKEPDSGDVQRIAQRIMRGLENQISFEGIKEQDRQGIRQDLTDIRAALLTLENTYCRGPNSQVTACLLKIEEMLGAV